MDKRLKGLRVQLWDQQKKNERKMRRKNTKKEDATKWINIRQQQKEFDDTGIVYYRDKLGNALRSPPGFEQKNIQTFREKNKITLKEGSLFNICLKFMTMNIDLLDSLVGLPEIIGHHLFVYMIQENVFKFDICLTGSWTPSDRQKIKILTLFDEAYDELVMKSISLMNVHENFDFKPLVSSFQNLVELDLSGRILPDEILSLLSKFYCLEKLILQNNNLTDESVSKLTLPYRVYKENPQELEILDISNNEKVTSKSMEHLLIFSKLKTLNLTGTSIVMHYSIVYELKQFGWQLSRDDPTYSKPNTVGWAEPIFSQLQFITSKCEEFSEASDFYLPMAKKKKKKKKRPKVTIKKTNLILIRNWCPAHTLKFNRSVLVDSGPANQNIKGKQRKMIPIKNNMNINKHGTSWKYTTNDNGIFLDDHENDDCDIFNQYSGGPPQKKSLWESLDDM